jgi:hypothetical protein
LSEIGGHISDIVDFEGSSLESRFIVKRGVDQEVQPPIFQYLTKKLDNMRDVYDGLQDLLAHTAYKISEGLEDEFAKMLDVMYFPQLVNSDCIS